MSEDLRAENERLKASNARLANHIVSIGETLEASRRELLATGWDAGMTRGQELAAWAIGNRPDSEKPDTSNPYRLSVPDFSGGIIVCKSRGDS